MSFYFAQNVLPGGGVFFGDPDDSVTPTPTPTGGTFPVLILGGNVITLTAGGYTYSRPIADVEIKEGDTVGVEVGIDDVTTLDDWTCQLQVRDMETKALAVDRAVTTYNEDQTKFAALITKSETKNSIGRGSHRIAIEMNNTVTGESVEQQVGLIVSSEWVYS